MTDGGLGPEEEETTSPLRRLELARIWRDEAERELDEAIYAAVAAGCRSAEIAQVLGVSPGAVRMQLMVIRTRKINSPV